MVTIATRITTICTTCEVVEVLVVSPCSLGIVSVTYVGM
jgi:hypothetical protein